MSAQLASNANSPTELISVIMPAYNAARFIREAITSILDQDDPYFEFIIVDDCSVDNTYLICAEYAQRDPRVTLLRTPVNSGCCGALNVGLAAAQGKLIARMDADDVSLRSRLSTQRAHLENNPSVGLCGMAIEVMDADGQRLFTRYTATGSGLLRRLSSLCSPLAHPTWMLRSEVTNELGGYRELAAAEDYDYLLRVLAAGWELSNIAEVGVRYRVSSSSTAARRALMQRKEFNYVRRINRNKDHFTRSSFAACTRSTNLMTQLHQASERLLSKAQANSRTLMPLALVQIAAAVIISPYQAQFVCRAVIVKWLIKRYSNRG